MVASTAIETFDSTALVEVGNAYEFVASEQVIPVVNPTEVVGIDTDRDGRLDQRVVLGVKLYDRNGNGLADPGETLRVRHKSNESLHDQASPYLSPRDLLRSVQRIADRINGILFR